eukprot:122377-Amphidinium_carterae.1
MEAASNVTAVPAESFQGVAFLSQLPFPLFVGSVFIWKHMVMRLFGVTGSSEVLASCQQFGVFRDRISNVYGVCASEAAKFRSRTNT